MIICIGPVCIPLWGVFPLLLAWLIKFWHVIVRFFKRLTGAEVESQDASADSIAPDNGDSDSSSDRRQRARLQYEDGDDTVTTTAASAEGLRRRTNKAPTGVTRVETEEQWDELLEQSARQKMPLVVKFTASWCKPCKAIAPHYQKWSQSGRAIFVEVDVDELEDVAHDAEAVALPTFQVYRNKSKVATLTGAKEQSLDDLLEQNI